MPRWWFIHSLFWETGMVIPSFRTISRTSIHRGKCHSELEQMWRSNGQSQAAVYSDRKSVV
jgi:hypothetical protein